MGRNFTIKIEMVKWRREKQEILLKIRETSLRPKNYQPPTISRWQDGSYRWINLKEAKSQGFFFKNYVLLQSHKQMTYMYVRTWPQFFKELHKESHYPVGKMYWLEYYWLKTKSIYLINYNKMYAKFPWRKLNAWRVWNQWNTATAYLTPSSNSHSVPQKKTF